MTIMWRIYNLFLKLIQFIFFVVLLFFLSYLCRNWKWNPPGSISPTNLHNSQRYRKKANCTDQLSRFTNIFVAIAIDWCITKVDNLSLHLFHCFHLYCTPWDKIYKICFGEKIYKVHEKLCEQNVGEIDLRRRSREIISIDKNAVFRLHFFMDIPFLTTKTTTREWP